MRKHGLSKTPIYKIWYGMHERCRGIGGDARKYYVPKNIKVCERWHIFENFLEDMGDKPGPGYSIDRIDNDGDYCPENCRWATATQQNRNRRNTVLITIEGETKPIGQWADEYSLPPQTIRKRMERGESGPALIRPKKQGHEIACNGDPCTCSSRRKYSPREKIINAVRKHQANGRPITLRRLCNRAGLTQSETLAICSELGFVARSDGNEWMRNWTVVEGANG